VTREKNSSHELDLNTPVSVSDNSLFRGLPSCIHPFGVLFSVISGTRLLFMLAVMS
jgi:hypothetical protein